ncbi:MAG: hypothetical protein WC716_06655 [Chitinophagaceae bacterium]
MIPSILYRGDADLNGVRLLKPTIDYGQWQTNLISGGIGKDIISLPLENLVNRHVGYGWNKTHFLSFSSDKQTAKRFGIGCEIRDLQKRLNELTEYYESNCEWHFALMEIDTRLIDINPLETGIYEAYFVPTVQEFARHNSKYRMLIIDVVTYLLSLNNFDLYCDAIENAERDNEYLILPATLKKFNHDHFGYSAILDGGCISRVTKFAEL